MTLYLDKHETEAVLDALQGNPLKCQAKYRESVIKQINAILFKNTSPPKGQFWAPIRSAWPSNFIRPARKTPERAPREKKPVEPKKEMTAEEILASL